MKNLLLISLVYFAVVFAGNTVAQVLNFPNEPIAYIGHGAMFNASGEEIQVTPVFIDKAVGFYKTAVFNQLDEQQQSDFNQEQSKYAYRKDWSDHENQLIQVTLLQGMVNASNLKNRHTLMGKVNLLKTHIKGQPGFRISHDLSVLFPLDPPFPSAPPPPPAACVTEPGIWPTDYTNTGSLTNPFISAGLQADVWVKDNSGGLCVALPRRNSQEIRLLGVICQDPSGMTCFWDNQDATGATDPVPLNATIDIQAEFPNGEDLNGGQGGRCTDCHAGENLLVIHPGTALLPNSYDTSTLNWATPDVHSSWKQNPGPGTKLENLDSAQVCAGCHNAGTSRRFPILQNFGSYCNTVLKQAIGNTMPNGGSSLISDINLLCDNNLANDPVNDPDPVDCNTAVTAGDWELDNGGQDFPMYTVNGIYTSFGSVSVELTHPATSSFQWQQVSGGAFWSTSNNGSEMTFTPNSQNNSISFKISAQTSCDIGDRTVTWHWQ